jgi:hypothetical protein
MKKQSNQNSAAPGDTREVHVGPLWFLEDLLWEWIAVQERSIRLWEQKDALWWYGERTSLGGFAGAVWRSGGFVLEEYSTEKMRELGKARLATGRADMDFAISGMKFMIEAKQCWPRLRAKGSLMHRVKKAFDEATDDARHVPHRPSYMKLAVVFAAPGSNQIDYVESQITNWVDAARKFDKECACAWVFPQSAKSLASPTYCKRYPGAALFIKRVGGKRLPTR